MFRDKHKNILVVSQIVNAILLIVFGKFVAIYFSPEEFGKFNIQYASYFLFFSVIIFPLLQFFKTKINSIEKEGHNFFLKFFLFLFLITDIILSFYFYFKFNATILLLILIFFTLLFNSLFIVINDYFNVKSKLLVFSFSNVFKNLSALIILIIFIYLIKADFNNELLWILQLLGMVFGSVFFINKYPIYIKKKLHLDFKKNVNEYFIYSWPLMILAFWNWINSYIDRYMIDYFLSIKDVGIYNANLGLGSKVFLILNPVFLAILNPLIFDKNISISKKKQKINNFVIFYFLLGISILLFLFFSYKDIGKMLLSELYTDGFSIIFWSAIAYFIITLSYLYELLFYAENKTRTILMGTIISALFYVIMNIFFIPRFQLFGVVISLILSAVLRFFYLKYQFNLCK